MSHKFFKKYIPEWHEVLWLVHEHWVRIIDKIFLYMIWFVFIPTFLYYFSENIRWFIPFYIFEIYLFIIYAKIVYEIFNRYNDVWIITNEWISDLDWALFKTNVQNVGYSNIEWIEVDQNSIWDKILNKWDITIHLVWDDKLVIKDAIIPYKAINKIEEISKEKMSWWDEERDKFDVFIDTLSWFLEKQLSNKWVKEEDFKEKEEVIFKAMEEWWTVDLRGK